MLGRALGNGVGRSVAGAEVSGPLSLPVDDSEPADSEPGAGVGHVGRLPRLHCPPAWQYALVCEVGLWLCGL